MAKGIAVVSGSNDVVFKALETGIITAGSGITYAQIGVSGSLSISGSQGTPSFYVDENGVQISGSFAFEGDLQVTGNVLATENISASLDLEAGRDLIVGGTGSFAGDLDVEGVSNLNGTLTVENGDLVVSVGTTTLADKLTVEAGGLEVTDGNLDVVNGNISGSSDILAGGDLIAAGNLDVEGEGNIAQKLTVQSGGLEVTSGDLDVVAGSISGSADLSAGGNLDVGGTADIGSTLTVESGGAYVTGDISGSADLLAGGNLAVAGDAEITGSLVVKGNLTVEGDITQENVNQVNLVVDDAIILIGSGSDAEGSLELGIVFGSENRKAFTLKDGEFYLGSTSDDTLDNDLTPDNDGLGKLILANLSASATVHALDLRVADSAEVTGTLDVRGDVTLGVDNAQTIVLNGVVTASADVVLEEDVTMGTDSDDLVKVVGQIRMPVFTVEEGHPNHVAGFPVIPADYAANKAAYNGHMFYLTSSDDTNWTASGSWAQGNKWYFNERGEWHASFLFAE